MLYLDDGVREAQREAANQTQVSLTPKHPVSTTSRNMRAPRGYTTRDEEHLQLTLKPILGAGVHVITMVVSVTSVL